MSQWGGLWVLCVTSGLKTCTHHTAWPGGGPSRVLYGIHLVDVCVACWLGLPQPVGSLHALIAPHAYRTRPVRQHTHVVYQHLLYLVAVFWLVSQQPASGFVLVTFWAQAPAAGDPFCLPLLRHPCRCTWQQQQPACVCLLLPCIGSACDSCPVPPVSLATAWLGRWDSDKHAECACLWLVFE